jgi:hypothetical protein
MSSPGKKIGSGLSVGTIDDILQMSGEAAKGLL